MQEAEGMCDFLFSSNEFVHGILFSLSYHRGTVALQWLVLVVRSSDPGSSPAWGHCVVFLGKAN